MKLSAYQIALLNECSRYALDDVTGGFYRLGGHGKSPLRHNAASLRKLRLLGLVESGSVIRATEFGKTTLFKLQRPANPAP